MGQLNQTLVQQDTMWWLENKVEIVPQKKIAKAVKYIGSSYEEKLEVIKIATEYARDNISPSNDSFHIFFDCQSAILAVTS